jgi:hypothetical protein
MKKIKTFLFIFGLFFVFSLLSSKPASATVVTDNVNGVYTDNFSDNTGLSSRSGIGVSQGKLQLLNASNGTTTPYVLTGNAFVSIWPQLIAKWGTLTFDAVTSATTSINIQVVDSTYEPFSDSQLPGNIAGFTHSPIDLSGLFTLMTATTSYRGGYPAKNDSFLFKITLNTTNGKYTPTIDNLNFTWTTKQGDLSSSTLANSPWPTTSNADNRGTAHSPYYPDSIYPALKWVKNLGIESEAKTIVANNNILINKTAGMNYVDNPLLNNNATFRKINSLTGETISEMKMNSSHTAFAMAEDGTIYIGDAFNDSLCAINSADWSVKWCYTFYGGHDGGVSLGSDGTIYYIRNGLTLYAFRPDGTIKWSRTITPQPGNSIVEAEDIKPVFNSDGDLYLSTTESDPGSNFTNKGHLYIISHVDGSILHTVDTGDLEEANIVIDENDVAYIGNGNTSNTWDYGITFNARILAINKDGTIKWIYDRHKTGCFYKLSLRSDGVLMAEEYMKKRIYAISTADGTEVWQASTTDMYFPPTYPGDLMSNGLNGFYYSDGWYNGPQRMRYYDNGYNQKWMFTASSSLSGLFDASGLIDPVMDENGNLFFVYRELFEDVSYAYSANNLTLLSFVPWHLSLSSNLAASYYRGNTINITAKSSMPAINPFNNEANKVQAVVDGNTKIPLTYGATDAQGNTLWTGSYTIPQSADIGNHNIVLEAAQSMITTDASTTFATYPSGTNNTGIRSTSTFALILPNSSSLPSGYNAQPGSTPAKPANAVFSIQINNGAQTTTDNRNITLNLTASPDTKNIAISENQNFQFASLESFTPTKQFQLSSGNGRKTIYVKFYTQYGFSTPAYQASIVLNEKTVVAPAAGQPNQPIISAPSLPNSTTPPASGGNSTANPGQSISIPTPAGNITANLPAGFTFQHTLQSGQTNSDIRQLQQFLTSLGSSIYPSGKITGYFGPLTRQAVIRFQEKYAQEILAPQGLKHGNGRVGPATLKKINSLLK